jgi:predicted DNA-binding transcriptional regulator AlpA
MTTTPTHSGLERLLTVHELSDYLGIPVATLYDWRVDEVGPRAVKLGRSLRCPELDFSTTTSAMPRIRCPGTASTAAPATTGGRAWPREANTETAGLEPQTF